MRNQAKNKVFTSDKRELGFLCFFIGKESKESKAEKTAFTLSKSLFSQNGSLTFLTFLTFLTSLPSLPVVGGVYSKLPFSRQYYMLQHLNNYRYESSDVE
jgi:hypothetical protein